MALREFRPSWLASRKDSLDREFDAEANAHLDLATDDYIARGHSPSEARRLARVTFGAVEAAKDAHRDARGWPRLSALLHDLRSGLGSLARDRAYSTAAIVMLALAIGLNATAFRVMDTMLLRGFRLVKDNDRILYITERFPGAGCCVQYVDFEQWRTEAHAFEDLAFMGMRSITLAEGDGDPRTIWASAFTPNIFRLAGVKPMLGRDFEASDTVVGAPQVVMVRYNYWRDRLGAPREIVGRNIRIDGAAAEVIGVMPEGFDFPGTGDIWLPLTDTPKLRERVANGGEVYGRLAPGATEAEARAQLDAIGLRLAHEYPSSNKDVRVVAGNYRERQGPAATLLYGPLWLGAWLVLLIACANVANLSLARSQDLARETSTRMALGAGRGRLVRQALFEHLTLAAIAAFVGWGISTACTNAWAVATAVPNARADYSVGYDTWAYFLAVAAVAALLIGCVPLARLWRFDVNHALKGDPRGATRTLSAKSLSAALVAAQMALAIILIAGAGVLARSLWKIMDADVGVTAPERVLIGQVSLPRGRYATPESRLAFFESLRSRIGAIAGVESAAVGIARPLDDFEPVSIEGDDQTGSRIVTPVYSASPDYFRSIGAVIAAGRDFEAADRPGGAPVALVNRRFADARFPGQNAVGRRIRVYRKYHLEPDDWRTIVGVTSDVMQNNSSRQEFRPVVYVPLAQQPPESAWFFARTTSVTDGLAAAIRSELREIDPRLEVERYSTLKTSLGFDFQSQRMNGLNRNVIIAPIYAGLALLLAVTGLYAVVARSVGRRTKEIGVRMALGAAPQAISRLVFSEGMTPVMAGLFVGLASAAVANRVLQAQLVGISPYDAPTFALASMVLVAVALFGCVWPVRRAMSVAPAIALRQD